MREYLKRVLGTETSNTRSFIPRRPFPRFIQRNQRCPLRQRETKQWEGNTLAMSGCGGTHVSFVSAVKQTGTDLYRSLSSGVQLRVTSASPFWSSLNTLFMFRGPLTWKSWMLQENNDLVKSSSGQLEMWWSCLKVHIKGQRTKKT